MTSRPVASCRQKQAAIFYSHAGKNKQQATANLKTTTIQIRQSAIQ
jgi:hypothetical protein